MREFFFIYMYGMLFWTSAFLTVFWGQFAIRRWLFIGNQWRNDHFFNAVLGIFLLVLGLSGVSAVRSEGNIRYGLSAILQNSEGTLLGVFLVIMLLGSTVLVRLADMQHGKPRWLWGMGAVAVLWGAACLWLVG